MSTNNVSNNKKRSRDEPGSTDTSVSSPKRTCSPNLNPESDEWYLVSLTTRSSNGTVHVSISKQDGAVTSDKYSARYSDAFAFLVAHGIYFTPSEADLLKLAKKTAFPPNISCPELANQSVIVKLEDKTRPPSNKVNDQNFYLIQLKGELAEISGKYPQDHVNVKFSRILCQGNELGQFNPDLKKSSKIPEIPAAPSPPSLPQSSLSPLSQSSLPLTKKVKWDVQPAGGR